MEKDGSSFGAAVLGVAAAATTARLQRESATAGLAAQLQRDSVTDGLV